MVLEGAEQSGDQRSDGYSGEISQDEMEGAAAGGKYPGPGQRQGEPGVGQGLRKPLTLETRLVDVFVPGSFQLKETPLPGAAWPSSPQHERFHFFPYFNFGRKSPHCAPF